MPKAYIKPENKSPWQYFLPPLVAACAVLAAFAIRGVYPFGSLTVDYYDMGQGAVASLCHLYDTLHGDASLFFNWFTALGINNATTSVPIYTLLFLFIPRSSIVNSLSFYFVLGAALSAFSMFFYLKKTRELGLFWNLVFSLCYAFCGYSLLYYTNIWFDFVFLFPLIMYGFERMMNEGRIIQYTVLLTLGLISNYYLGFMSLIYLFFAGGLYVFLILPREKRKQSVWNLGISTVCAMGISMASVLPKLIQAFGSQRATDLAEGESKGILSSLLEIYNTITFKSRDKWGMLILAALPCAIIVIGLIKNRADKKRNWFFVLNIFLIAVMIVVEGTCLIYHFGSYFAFPMRNGFILTFALISAASYYLKPIIEEIKPTGTARKVISVIFSVLLFAAVLAALYLSRDYLSEYTAAFVAFAAFFVLYLAIFLFKNKALGVKVAAALLAAEIIGYTFLFVPLGSFVPESTQNSDYFVVSQQLTDDLKLDSSTLERVKNTDMSLSPNYPYALRRAALSDWTHTIAQEIQPRLDEWGYSVRYTRLLDAGGTVFTDAVLNVKNIISQNAEPSELYTAVGVSGNYTYYTCNYTLPFGSLIAEGIDSIQGDWIDVNNALYADYSDTDGELVARLATEIGLGDRAEYELQITEKSAVYVSISNADNARLYVNGEPLVVSSTENIDNLAYPAGYNKNVVLLGVFENETVDFEADLSLGDNEDARVVLGALDLNKLEALCGSLSDSGAAAQAQGSTLTMSIDSEAGSLVIPLLADRGWSATVNGEEAEISSAYGFMCSVEVPGGHSEIVFSYARVGQILGVIVSAASILLFAFVLIMKKRGLVHFEFGLKALYAAFVALWCVAALAVYVLPIGFFAVGLARMYL